jgi:Planctomycete cytochrome C
MKKISRILSSLALASSTVLAGDKWDISKLDLSKLPPAAAQSDVTYAKDIRPLLEASCLRCHGEERAKADLRLDSLPSTLAGGKDGKVVIAGESKNSLLVAAAAQVNNDVAMPPKRGPGHGGPPAGPGGPGGFGPPPKALTAEQVGLIRAWIDQGAK